MNLDDLKERIEEFERTKFDFEHLGDLPEDFRDPAMRVMVDTLLKQNKALFDFISYLMMLVQHAKEQENDNQT
jgi:hypothetical protein